MSFYFEAYLNQARFEKTNFFLRQKEKWLALNTFFFGQEKPIMLFGTWLCWLQVLKYCNKSRNKDAWASPQRGSRRGHLPPRFSKKGIIGTFLCVLAANLIEGKNTQSHIFSFSWKDAGCKGQNTNIQSLLHPLSTQN